MRCSDVVSVQKGDVEAGVVNGEDVKRSKIQALREEVQRIGLFKESE